MKFKIIFFLSIILSSCEQKIDAGDEKDNIEECIFYYEGSPFNGFSSKSFPNDEGAILVLKYKNGRINGSSYEKYYGEDVLKSKITYKDRKIYSYEEYYINGQLKEKKVNGQYEIYFNNGELKEKGRFDGFLQKEKWNETWFTISEEMDEFECLFYYKNKPYTGILINFFDDEKTQLETKVTYKEGKKDGTYQEYYENGELKIIASYREGKKDGTYQEYYENGQLKTDQVYREGEWAGTYQEYYENGQKKRFKVTSGERKISSSSFSTTVTFKEAEFFMQQRCNDINQNLMRKKVTNFNGTKMYMFLSVATNGYVCISSISENKLEVIATDCGPSEIKIQQWNAIN